MKAADTEARLENWAILLRQRHFPEAVSSVEGLHEPKHPEQWFDPREEAPSPPRIELDREDAAVVELAVRSIQSLNHWIIRGHYLGRWTPWKILRLAYQCAGQPMPAYRARNVSTVYDLHLRASIFMVGQALAAPAVIRKTRANDLIDAAFALALAEEDEPEVAAA